MTVRNDDKQDMIIDAYIRNQVSKISHMQHIEPSADFSSRVLQMATDCEKRHQRTMIMATAVIALIPCVLQQTWMLFRNDSFSLSSIPMGNIISAIYNAMITPQAFFTLFGTGIIVTALITWKRSSRHQTQPAKS